MTTLPSAPTTITSDHMPDHNAERFPCDLALLSARECNKLLSHVSPVFGIPAPATARGG